MLKTSVSAAQRHRLPARVVTAAITLTLPFALACGVEEFNPTPPTDPSALFWDLALNHRAVTLALGKPYDTLSLVAVAHNPSGQPLSGLPAPAYVSNDPANVVVTPDGVLRAVGLTSQPVLVTATVTTRNIKHADTLWVRVLDVANPPSLASFSVRPVPPDSAKIGLNSGWFMPPLPVHAVDGQGQPMTDLLVAFRSSNEDIATIAPLTGVITGSRVGKVRFFASTTMFGVNKTASVDYQIGLPVLNGIAIQDSTYAARFYPTIILGVGGLVQFLSFSAPALSVEFDDADLPNIQSVSSFSERDRYPSGGSYSFFCSLADCVGTGNIIDQAPYGAFRVFTAPGVYNYRCTPCGQFGTVVGRIMVIDESQP